MKLVLFDWNGTLLDDTPVWFEAVKETFRVFGKQPPTMAEYFSEFGGDYLQLYRSRGIDASRDELNRIYEEYYDAFALSSNLMPKVKETLWALWARGVKLGLVTGQKFSQVHPFLTGFGLASSFQFMYFHVIDKKSVIWGILGSQAIHPAACCYVGDTPSDIRHGNKVGVKTIAFLGGHIPENLIMSAKPTHTIRQFSELTSLI